jgi:hypothetical protein
MNWLFVVKTKKTSLESTNDCGLPARSWPETGFGEITSSSDARTLEIAPGLRHGRSPHGSLASAV